MANNSTINKILNNKTKKEKETVKAVADSITKQRGGTTTSTTTTSDNSATKSAIASLLKNTNTTAEKAASAVSNVTNQSKLNTPTDLKDKTTKTPAAAQTATNSAGTKEASKTSTKTADTKSATTKDTTKAMTSSTSSYSSTKSSTKDDVKSSISDKKSSTTSSAKKSSSAKSTEKKITGIDMLLGNAAKTSGNAKTASSAKTEKRNDNVDKLLNMQNSKSSKKNDLIAGSRSQQAPTSLLDIYNQAEGPLKSAVAKQALKLSSAQEWNNKNAKNMYGDLAGQRDYWTAQLASAQAKANPQEANEKRQDELFAGMKSAAIRNSRMVPKITYRDENYNDNAEHDDEMLYDQFYGAGAYKKISEHGTREQKERMWAEIRDIWDDIDSGRVEELDKVVRGLYGNESNYDQAESDVRYAERMLKDINRKQEEEADYMDLMWKYSDVTQDPDYVPEYDKGGFTYGMNEMEKGVQTSDISRIYSFLGKGKEYDEWAKYSITNGDARVSNEYNYAMMMTDGSEESNDEIGTFMKLYNKAMEEGREPEEAKAFYDALLPYLQQRYEQFETIAVSEAANKMPVLTSIASLGMDVADAYMDVARHVAHAFGNKNTENRNSAFFAGSRQSETIKNAVSEKIGGLGGKIYNNFMNAGSNFLRALTTPGETKLVKEVLGLGQFFLQVDQQATARYLKDHSYDEAQKLAAIDATFELAEEFLPYETMLGSVGKGVGLALIENGLSELGQEFTGATVFEKIKGIITGEDSEQARADEIFNKGFYVDSNGNKVMLDPDSKIALQQSRVQAAKEAWNEAVENGLGGFFGGSVGGIYGTIAEKAGLVNYEKNVNKQIGAKALYSGTENIANIKENAAEIRGEQYDNIRTLIEAAAKMGEDTDSYKIGKQLEEVVRSGNVEKVKPQQVGKLVRALMGETSGEIQQTVKNMIGNTLEQRLAQMGETGENVHIKGQALANLIADQYSMEDLMVLAADKQTKTGNMAKLLEEYRMSGTEEKIREAINEKIKEPASIQETVAAMVGNPKVSADAIRNMVNNAEVASAKEIRDAEGESTGSALEVITEGKIKEIASVQTIKKKEINEEGKEVEVKRLQINFTDGTSTDVANTKAAGLGTAQVLQFAQMNGNQTNSDEITNILLKNVNKTNDATNMIAGAQRILWDVATGIKTGRSGLTPNLENQIREAAESSYEKWNKERRNSYRKINPGNGIVTYNGALYGTEDFTKALAKDNRLSNRQRTEAMMVGKIAQAMGFDVALTYDDKNTWNQGHYASNEGIVINMAGNYVDGIKRSALATLPHEITHWLEANSPEMALKLRKFVLTAQANQGLDVQQRLQGIMDQYKNRGVDVDIFGAISELTAKSCEAVLTNESMVRKMREENPELYGKVYNAVMSVVDRVKDALKMARVTSSVYAKNLEIYGDRLADVWRRTYEEAKNATGKGEESGDQSKAQLSVIELTDGTRIAVEDENILDSKPEGIGTARFIYNYLTEHIGDKEIIDSTSDVVYLGKALPREYINSKYTKELQSGNKKKLAIKNRTAGFIIDAIKTAYNKTGPFVAKHTNKNALYGVYKYNTKIAFPVRNKNGDVVDYNAYTAQMIVNHTGKNKLDLYDIIDIEKDTATGRKLKTESAGGLTKVIRHQSSAYTNNLAQKNNNSKTQNSIQESDAEYMQAVDSDDMETAQRIVDQTAEENGYTIKGWHGSDADERFTVFKPGQRGEMWFSSTKDTAYNKRKNMYETYLKMKNPYQETDYIGADTEFDPVAVTEKGRNEKHDGAIVHFRLDPVLVNRNLDIIKKAFPDMKADDEFGNNFRFLPDAETRKALMKDGETLAEFMERGTKEDLYQWYTVYRPEQIKSADAVTYDDDGNVIPPSERFKTEKKDIRYSVQESDAEYMQAVNSGDMEEAQKIVDQAAETAMPNSKVRDKTGKLLKVYHGTKADFNEFRRDYIGSTGRFEGSGFNFTPYEGRAKSYGGNVLAGYLNIQNPLSAEEKTISVAKLARLIREADPTGDNIISDYARETRDYGSDSFVRRESMTAARNIWEASENDVDIYSFISAADSDAEGLISKFAELGYDGLIHYNDDGRIKTAVAFSSEQFKKADPVTYDDDGDIIPLSERFNEGKTDIRYSIADDEGNTLAAEVVPGTVAKYSLQSWMEDDWYKIYNSLRRAGYEAEDIRKWMTDVNSVAAIIAADKDRLDYKADRDQKYLKKNADVYKYTLDASTLCAKRLLYQGTFNAIQAMLPNTPLKPGDLIDLANMMHEMGYQTPCGICYVESKRRHTGNAAEQFLQKYKGEYIPKIAELTSTEGLAKLKQEHPQAYKDFIKAMNARGSGSVKLVQMRTDYRRDVRRMSKNMVEYLNSVGGLRIQSFSDFETPHLIDMMQALLDMTAKGLKSQAYTKVPNFAWVFGDTGIKINLSLMGEGTGLDSKGRLKFSDTEGMKFKDAMALRDRYSENVGTILVGMNDAHIIAAMGDNRIDFIIPFHKSGWSAEELSKMKTLEHYEDYQDYQNERKITGRENGKYITVKTDNGNIDPISYWDYSKTGTENAQRYLEICAEQGLQPKFYNFLVDNGDGTYSMPTDNSERSRNIRNGYWKTLIDFKMYDNDGVGVPQRTVTPNVNMEEAERVLAEYEGGANTLPVAQPVVERYVKEYKEKHQDKTQFSIEDDNEGNIYYWMRSVKPETLQTAAEKELLEHFKAVDMRIDLRRARIMELKDKIAKLEAMGDKLDRDGKRRIQKWKVEMANAQQVKEAAEAELAEIISSEGYGKMMKNQQRIFNDFMYGKTSAEVTEEVGNLQKQGEKIAQMIDENMKRVKEIESKGVIGQLKKILGTTTADQTAAELKKEFHSTWTKGQIRNYIDPILLKLGNGQDITSDVEELAGILIDSDERNEYEGLSALRGLTIRIGHGMMNELHANDSSLKEIRNRLAGTGIKVVAAKKVNGQWESSTLEQDIEDLRAQFPNMPELGNEKDALENFVSWVEGMKQQSGGQEFYAERLAEAMAQIMTKVVSTAQGMYIPTEAKAQKQVLALVEFVKGLQAQTESAISTLENVAEEATKLMKSGGKAAGLANVLTQHIGEALEYYDKTAKIAVDKAKQERNNTIVEQLKSKHAQDIAKRNEEWRNLIERDKQARKTAEDIQRGRNMINTALKRTLNLLKNPKGTKNIPEYMQGLARELLTYFVDNDLNELRRQKITLADKAKLEETKRLLNAWEEQDGPFNMADLNAAQNEDVVPIFVENDLMTIADCLEQLNGNIRGKNRLDTLNQRAEVMKQLQEAVGEIYSIIRKEGEIQVRDRQVDTSEQAWKILQNTNGKRYREWTGKPGNIIRFLNKAIVQGNMTPEYFFRMLANEGLSELWENYHAAENRNGLELKKAQERLAEIAEKHGYKNWDTKQKVKLNLDSGDVEITLGQLMSLWATWKRENTLGPAMSEHLTKGGFHAEVDLRDGKFGRTEVERKAHRVTENDMKRVEALLTDEQLAFIDDVVSFMSNEMSELGNEASMAAYGIRMYKEKYYFPFQMWDGVKNQKSNDSGSAAGAQDRAFHPSFSKTRMHGANNAIILGDFLQTATDHIVGMINYATMGLANENLQKVLNYKMTEGNSTLDQTTRNVKTILEDAYGQQAMKYLQELKTQLNGGAVKVEKTFYDKLISLFRKNAVAGSLSVAFQQPLSYIRAATMVSPKYLARALSPDMWKGSYKEMLEHSGVAVIKDMGRFDMNFGQGAREFLMPDGYQKTMPKIWGTITEKATILPELMDRMTWTRMWSACKAEMKALHPEMDAKSDEFLDMVGERFNDLMRRTQVYDSVLVKSANMRNQNPGIKMMTSFMAEPTLTANVLADSVRAAVKGEKGGKALMAKAGATFLFSAVMQAAVKGVFGAGRNPDDKKNWWENFLYRFFSNLIGEADPMTLIPGYSTAIDLMKGSDISDNAIGAAGKLFDAAKTGIDALLGNKSRGAWRDVEDSVGQIVQLFTNLPAKNLMRDARAMYNWVTGAMEENSPYAWRGTDWNVVKNQTKDLFYNADNLIGVVNQYMGEAGYQTSNAAYYKRIYEAQKAGNEAEAQSMIDYLIKGKGVKEKTISDKLIAEAKADESMSAEETAEFMTQNGRDAEDYIRDQLREGNMTPEEARKQLKKTNPEKDDNAIWWQVDRIEYQLETGAEKAPGGNSYYYRLSDAVDNNSVQEIRSAVKELKEHGVTEKKILDKTSDWKAAYLQADNAGKVKIRNAIQQVYIAAGSTAAEADKKINKWK